MKHMNLDTFGTFGTLVQQRFAEMSKHELFITNPLDLFETYLNAFPEGTNPVFRERTEHDCNCCKQFIRRIGTLVAIIDGQRVTVWDDHEQMPYPYNEVARLLSQVVKQAEIQTVFRTKERQYGTAVTPDNKLDILWKHLVGRVADKHFSTKPDTVRGEIEANIQVFRRGVKELTLDALDTVIDLIKSEAVYRGAEFLKPVENFRALKLAYEAAADRDLFVMAHYDQPASRVRNSAIGTLLVDLSEGVEIEKAVKSFEAKVAPTNYKRPKALITTKMVEDAVAKLRELDLEGAINRRMARIGDVSVNSVLFVDNSVQTKMKDALSDLLLSEVKPATVDVKTATPISIDAFVAEVLPGATALQLLVENKHQGNFMTVTGGDGSERLFKWNNNFAWSYDGDVADSMRQKVAALGGRVDGALRFTHSWNHDKRNASLMDLHVFMPGYASGYEKDGCNDSYPSSPRVGWNRRNDHASGGIQDVDYTAPAPEGHIPVENISFPSVAKMPDGDYLMKVHNWNLRRPTEGGFRAEIEFAGQIFSYDHPAPLKHKEWVTLAKVTLKNGQFSIEHRHSMSTSPIKKWGISTHTLTPVDTLMLSPNHWDDQAVGNCHWFFILKDCKNPNPTRGIYNEFLRAEFEPHRKVFEVLGTKTKCEPTDDQLSGVGFSKGRDDAVTVLVTKGKATRAYTLNF